AIIARDQGSRGDGHDGADATMAPAFVAAGVFEFSQGLKEAFGLSEAQRILTRLRFAPVTRPSRGHDRGRENLASFGVEGVEKDRLGLVVELVEVNAGASEAFGQADFNPIGRPITRAFETLGVHIGFDQEDGMLVVLLPIVTEAFEVEAQEMGGQIRRLTLGREQGKASIAGHEVTPGIALSVAPAYPSITGAQMKSGTGPA